MSHGGSARLASASSVEGLIQPPSTVDFLMQAPFEA